MCDTHELCMALVGLVCIGSIGAGEKHFALDMSLESSAESCIEVFQSFLPAI